jgi:hypothetical protein
MRRPQRGKTREEPLQWYENMCSSDNKEVLKGRRREIWDKENVNEQLKKIPD